MSTLVMKGHKQFFIEYFSIKILCIVIKGLLRLVKVKIIII